MSEEDWNHDGRIDEIEFTLQTPGEMTKMSLQLFFDLKLKVNINLNNIIKIKITKYFFIPEILQLSQHSHSFPIRHSEPVQPHLLLVATLPETLLQLSNFLSPPRDPLQTPKSLLPLSRRLHFPKHPQPHREESRLLLLPPPQILLRPLNPSEYP